MTAGLVEAGRTDASLVVDASVTAAWCFEDEASPFAEAALDRVVQVGAHVPALWAFEMSNVLAMAERRGRVQADRAHQLLDGLLALPIIRDDRDPALSAPDLMRLARAHDLTASDAAYLELAMRLGQTFATRDAALQRAANRVGVRLFEA